MSIIWTTTCMLTDAPVGIIYDNKIVFAHARVIFGKDTAKFKSLPGWVWVQISQLIYVIPIMACHVTSILFRQGSENWSYGFPPGFSILSSRALRSWIDFQLEKCEKNKNKNRKLYKTGAHGPLFLMTDFKTYLILFKILGNIDLKINCSLKTPLHRQKGVALSGLWAPVQDNFNGWTTHKIP